jgi:hypothetical protein
MLTTNGMPPEVIVRVPVVLPTTVGVKTIVTTHESPAGIELPQVFPVIA